MNDININALINNYCNRREFVKDALTGIGSVAFGSFIMINQSSCSDGSPTAPTDSNGGTSITVDLLLPENSSLATVGGTLALTANELTARAYSYTGKVIPVCWHSAEFARIMVVQLVRFRMVHLHVPVMAASSIHRAVL